MRKSRSDKDFGSLPRGRAEPPSPRHDGPAIGQRLLARRRELGLTLRQVAAKAGCARSYLSMIERGRRAAPPGHALLDRLEIALDLPPGSLRALADWHQTPPAVRQRVAALEDDRRAAAAELRELLATPPPRSLPGSPSRALDELWRTGRLRQLVERLDRGPAAREAPCSDSTPPRDGPSSPIPQPYLIPLINSVAAGYPRDFTDLGYPARTADSFVRSPDVADPDAFACRVVGDSMAPDYREGDIVIFSPARQVKDGADCFVRLEPDHETTFKRVFFVDGHGRPAPDGVTHIRLQPLNPAYPSRTLPREQVAGLYAAVSVTRRIP